jgi:hypothetical protein
MADVDNDGFLEIIAGGINSFVYIINSKGVLEQKYNAGYRVHALACHDIDGDGDVEIIAGSANLHVFSLTKRNLPSDEVKGWQYHSGGRYKIALGDIDGDGAAEIITGDSDSVTAYKANGKTLWHFDTGQVWDLTTGKIGEEQSEEIVIRTLKNLVYLDSQGRIKWQREMESLS